MGHPTGRPALHMAMTAKRRRKLKLLAEEIPLPEVYGNPQGDTLIVGWGSTFDPIREAVDRAKNVSSLHLRHLHPLPNGLDGVFARFNRIIVAEMNDEGLYGFGQLATLLRARFCDPKIHSLTKTDGLTFRVKEILQGILS